MDIVHMINETIPRLVNIFHKSNETDIIKRSNKRDIKHRSNETFSIVVM